MTSDKNITKGFLPMTIQLTRNATINDNDIWTCRVLAIDIKVSIPDSRHTAGGTDNC